MNKRNTIISTLILGVLGTSTVALASPDSSRGDAYRRESYSARRETYNDARGSRDDRGSWGWRDQDRAIDAGPRRYRTSWVALGDLQLLGSRSDTISVRDRGTFTQLRLQTAAGASRVERVVIRFADGGRQVVDLDRRLDRASGMLEIPLDGNNRRIDRITVEGGGGRRGALQVFAI